MTKALPILLASTVSLLAQDTTLFSEDFSNQASAANRFTVNGTASFANGAMRLSPASFGVLNTANLADAGNESTLYSVIQSFGGTINPSADFRVRGSTGTQYDGYYLWTGILSGSPWIALNRRTDAERQMGIMQETLLGGSSFAPPPLATAGPYRLDVLLVNKPQSVAITVSVNGVAAFVTEDTSPYRLTHGDSLGFYNIGSQNAVWDNLTVTAVPEPGACALTLIGLVALGCKIKCVGRNV